MARRRKKLGEYDPIVEAELDLHGYYVEEARTCTREFLNKARTDGLSRV
ncbi:MAG: Smr/MutS family protein [Candidatus Pacebacteria bacterium]|nr:Smr/MutS family protein [Candidatus Paceibacterota bacterium]